MGEQNRSPNPIDVHVGARIRMRRRALGISQEKLAEDLGLTFQQVQKYERGSNRVSASKLYEIARSLATPIGFFFDGLDDPTEGPSKTGGVHAFLASNEGLELASAFPRIGGPRLRRKVIELVRAMADGEDETA